MKRRHVIKLVRLSSLLGLFLMAMAGLSIWTYAQSTAADFSKGSIQIGYDSQTCDAALEGTIRYDSGGGALQLCTAAAWTNW